MNNIKKGIKFFILLAVIIWIVSLMKCEILTYQHGIEFKGLESQTNMLYAGQLKVLEYTETTAKVYYIDADKLGGDVLTFEKLDNEWCYVYWETIWSATGSAEGVQWPYIFDWL